MVLGLQSTVSAVVSYCTWLYTAICNQQEMQQLNAASGGLHLFQLSRVFPEVSKCCSIWSIFYTGAVTAVMNKPCQVCLHMPWRLIQYIQ